MFLGVEYPISSSIERQQFSSVKIERQVEEKKTNSIRLKLIEKKNRPEFRRRTAEVFETRSKINI